MKVAIVGYGFVGKALNNALKKEVEIIKIDPLLETSLKDLVSFKPDFIFLCLPTPMCDDGSQDISILENVFHEISSHKITGNIILKSTVTPDNLLMLSKYSDFILNPEFLREKNADTDFINGEIVLFGGESKLCQEASNFYLDFTKCKQKEHFITDKISASLIKYSINSFLATKVIFFNQLKTLLDKSESNISWKDFINIISTDKRIGDSHMDVPGHDGREGFGGACFPKDISALEKFASSKGFDFSIIKQVIKTNNQIRSVYNDLTKRESDQNITFKEEK